VRTLETLKDFISNQAQKLMNHLGHNEEMRAAEQQHREDMELLVNENKGLHENKKLYEIIPNGRSRSNSVPLPFSSTVQSDGSSDCESDEEPLLSPSRKGKHYGSTLPIFKAFRKRGHTESDFRAPTTFFDFKMGLHLSVFFDSFELFYHYNL